MWRVWVVPPQLHHKNEGLHLGQTRAFIMLSRRVIVHGCDVDFSISNTCIGFHQKSIRGCHRPASFWTISSFLNYFHRLPRPELAPLNRNIVSPDVWQIHDVGLWEKGMFLLIPFGDACRHTSHQRPKKQYRNAAIESEK
jgi:hypothetical protein